jgi:hypothetical protein
MPGDLRELLASAINKGSKALGYEIPAETAGSALRHLPITGLFMGGPTSQQLQSGIESASGKFYEPQTMAGHYAQTAGEFLPAVIGGPESLATKLATRVAAPALASETATQAAKGTALEPYAGPAAAVAAAVLAHRAPAKAPVPSIEQVKNAATAGYNAPEIAAVAFKPQAIEALSNSISSDLSRSRINQKLAPQTHSIVEDLKNPVAAGGVHGIEDIETTRRLLGDVAGNFANPVEQKAASKAIAALDKYSDNVPQSHLLAGDAAAANEALTTARANYASAKTAEKVQEKLRNAEWQAGSAHSGGNIDNATRQKLRTLLTSKTGARGLTEAELAQIEQTVRGSTAGNLLRSAGKLVGGGGGLGMLHGGALGAFAGGLPGAVAVPALGYGVKKLGDAVTRRNASAIVDQILSRSPEAASWAAIHARVTPNSSGRLTRAAVTGLLALQQEQQRQHGLLPLDQSAQ